MKAKSSACWRWADWVFFDSLVAATRRAGLPLSAHTHVLSREGILALGAVGGAIDHGTTLVNALGYQLLWGQPAQTRKPVEVSLAKVQELGTAMQRAGVWFVPTLGCETIAKPWTPIKDIPQIVKTLHDAGVKMLLAGDEANVQQDLAMFVRAGLTPYQALLTGTRNVAEYFGALDSLGTVAKFLQATDLLDTIAPSKLADLVCSRPIRSPTSAM
jgi:imidazolonepropionase-like amidohydrolase